MKQNFQTDLLEPQRSASARSASDMSNEEDELPSLLQQQAGTLSPTVAFKESENASQRNQKTSSRYITGIQVQPISVSPALGAKSTLRGTPWEEALGGVTRPQTGKRSKKAGKPAQRTVKEMEIISFWTQFFG